MLFISTYQCITSEDSWVLTLFARDVITYMPFGVADDRRPIKEN